MANLEPGLKIPEAASALNCHPNTVKQMIRKGILSTYRVGVGKQRPGVRVTRDSVERRLAGEKNRK